MSLNDIPIEDRTKEVCWEYLKSNPHNFEYIPGIRWIEGDILDNEMIEWALCNNYLNILRYVPDNHPIITKDFYIRVIGLDPYNICQVPEGKYGRKSICYFTMDDEMVDLAIKSSIDRSFYGGVILECIPNKYRTIDRCLKCLTYGADLRYVPGSEYNFNFIGDLFELHFDKIINTIFESNFTDIAGSFKSIPKKYVTQDLLLRYLRAGADIFWDMLNKVPEMLDEEIIDLSIELDPRDRLRAIPPKFLNEDLIVNLMPKIPLSQIPYDFRTKKICKYYLEKNASDFHMIPKEIMDEELMILGVRGNKKALRKIPLELVTFRVAVESYKNSSSSISHLPEDRKKEIRNYKTQNIKSAME